MQNPNPVKTFSRRCFLKNTGIAATGLLVLHGSVLGLGSKKQGLNTTIILNPTPYNFKNELVRLKTPPPGPAGSFVVKMDGSEIPYQVEDVNGNKQIWICAGFDSGAKYQFEVIQGTPGSFPSKVSLKEEAGFYLLDNGKVCIKVPSHSTKNIPGPIAGIRLANGTFVGNSEWNTTKQLKKYSVTETGNGSLFAKLRLRYEFEEKAGADQKTSAFAEIEIMLGPDWEHVSIFESHEMGCDDYWQLILSDGWSPRNGISRQFNNGAGGSTNYLVPPMDRALVPINNVSYSPGLYINLIPRWNQHYKDGWAFGVTDGEQHVSAVAVKASQWVWPHDNNLPCIVKPEGNFAAINCSTWHGQRLWWLAASLAPVDTNYIARHAWENIDKINHDYILDYPGKNVKWWGINPYDSEQTNPTHSIRRIGKTALKNAGQGPDETTLIRFQTLIHNDCWGSYWNHFSPENPNFFTDYNLVPIALAANLNDHPNFEIFRKMAENKFREDLYHSITLPGGAGQECPGYSHYGMSLWREIAAMGQKHLGFDMDFINERLLAADKFYKRISFPDGDIRRGSPVGDSHPDRKTKSGMPLVEVDKDVVKSWKTEELPGFGVIFTNHPGTSRETYLSFKSGPNRCHYHGDQLSFHYCANGRPVAVDHHCSYNPRAGQEHIHNRMAFFTDDMPYANMDGYEHLLAIKTSADADIAVGQVESKRFRAVLPLPPEAWDARYPQLQFNHPLIYRRTVVMMKNGEQDYFVFRDQYWADRPIKAAFCLHTYGDNALRQGQTISFGKLSVFCTHTDFTMKNFNWSHENGGTESTSGIRLEISGATGEMITVMYPGNVLPPTRIIPGGVQVGNDAILFDGNEPEASRNDEVVEIKRVGKKIISLMGNEIDFNRSQGEIGLFVPDAGYPFGEIPDWLIRQRASKPKWAEGL